MSKRFNKKGLSTGAALVVIISIAVVIITLVYAWDTGLISRSYAKQMEKTGDIELESLYVSGSTVVVCVRNTTEIDILVVSEYRNGALVTRGLNQIIPQGDVLCFPLTSMYFLGDEVVLMTEGGTKVRFRVGTEFIESEPEESGALMMENHHLSNGVLTVCIRNTTYSVAFITTEYKNDVLVSGTLNYWVGSHDVACFELTGSYDPGDEVMLVTDEGVRITFVVGTGWVSGEADVEGEPEIVMESMRLSGSELVICLRNTTDRDLFIDAEYQDGVLVVADYALRIPKNGVTCFTLAGYYYKGDEIMIVTEDGIKIIFIVK